MSQNARSGSLWSWVPDTEALMPLLSPAQWGRHSQTGPLAHLPARPQLCPHGEGQRHKSQSKQRVSESWMGLLGVPLVCTWHTG